MLDVFVTVLFESWRVLLEASVFILIGLTAAGLIRVFLSADAVARHLGRGRFLPVIKASLLGIPLPL
ncbi:MAG: hypothetical protein QNI85_03310 [Desulfobacterales bacterium]|nr:hypothetical protein [Desulfobacterales bacterium]MDJ0989015.1 hypothetical protein [Desulfobacterales bacterium]